MKQMTIFILGGYGGAGLPLAKYLLQQTTVHVVLAGRHADKAQAAAETLNAFFPGQRASARFADASDKTGLISALKGSDVLVVCSPVTHLADDVAHAALEAGVDYLDIYYPQKVVAVLQALAPEIEKAGRCFITQAGFHPGLLAPFIRYAAPLFNTFEKAFVGMAMRMPEIGTTESAREIIEGVADFESYVYRQGEWQKAGYKDLRKFDFGPGFGKQLCYPMWFEEMRSLPQDFGLKEAGSYVAGFNWFIDNVVFSLAMLLFRIRKGLCAKGLTRLMIWANKRFSKPPYGVVFRLEAAGMKDNRPLTWTLTAFHENGYDFTAIAATACLLQYLDGSIRHPGLHLMGTTVDASRLMGDLEVMGVWLKMDAHNQHPS